jgi:hypothetical protein
MTRLTAGLQAGINDVPDDEVDSIPNKEETERTGDRGDQTVEHLREGYRKGRWGFWYQVCFGSVFLNSFGG